ncbi:hypothetical protein DS425_23620, partial [Salmonella enterica subsp. enterica]|nr:hypothetical protein [Salmonella enterica subsp. enterica serovar Berkeley]
MGCCPRFLTVTLVSAPEFRTLENFSLPPIFFLGGEIAALCIIIPRIIFAKLSLNFASRLPITRLTTVCNQKGRRHGFNFI